MSTPDRVINAWRIVKNTYASEAFDGEGARLLGGRWNSPGHRVVYTSQSAALATLEILVHLGSSSALASWVLIGCRIPEGLVKVADGASLPKHWRRFPAPEELQRIGNEWMTSGASAVLEVPSAIIESEHNYLLNPEHKDFRRIEVQEPLPFSFDVRLGREGRGSV